MKLLTVLSLLFFVACNSPIVNHHQAQDQDPQQENEPTPQVVSGKKLTGCDFVFKTKKLCATFDWVKEPVSTKDRGSFTLKFWDPDQTTDAGPYVDPKLDLEVYLWMSVHGHGSAPVGIAESADSKGVRLDGEYTISDVLFVMKGPWEIHVNLVNSKGKTIDKAELAYTF